MDTTRERLNWSQHQARWWRNVVLTCIVSLGLSMWAMSCDGGSIPVHAQTTFAPAAALPLEVKAFYSPAENLEVIDLGILDQAQKSIDISTYAMDDRPIAEELVKLAQRGVAIRIYRDLTQYQGEVAHGKKGGTDLNTLFAGQSNIQVKVKGVTALAHLKAYVVDGRLLREGSANWSAQGEKVQDNSLLLIQVPAVVARFETDFQAIWSRPSNQTIQ